VRITILPKTTLGKWSFGLALSLILFFGIFLALSFMGAIGGDEGFTWGVALILASWGILAAAASITGLISIIKSRERSILIFSVIILGAFFLMLILGEFLVAH
jgi:hypothetical protein